MINHQKKVEKYDLTSEKKIENIKSLIEDHKRKIDEYLLIDINKDSKMRREAL